MFEGEKTLAFWGGLFVVGFSLCGLFTTLWVIGFSPSLWIYITPVAFGCAVFLVIGFYMMILGAKKTAGSN